MYIGGSSEIYYLTLIYSAKITHYVKYAGIFFLHRFTNYSVLIFRHFKTMVNGTEWVEMR